MITPAQCRAARALLDWSQQALADGAKIGNATIRNFESGKTTPQNATLEMIRQTLVEAGVIFIDQNGDGPGVRLRKNIAAE
jgi:transcriptional regulator with XRE-family HTH domain